MLNSFNNANKTSALGKSVDDVSGGLIMLHRQFDRSLDQTIQNSEDIDPTIFRSEAVGQESGTHS